MLLAAPRGYCAGVDRAVIAVEKALDHYGEPVYVRKQIVHNVHVVSELEKRGAIFVDDVAEVPDRIPHRLQRPRREPRRRARPPPTASSTRSTPPARSSPRCTARRCGSRRHDATILLIGHAGHEEVEGTMGQAPERTILVGSPEEVDTIVVPDTDNLVWISQTTLSVDETMDTVRRLRERFPHLQDPPSDDICYATQNRQVAIKKVAPDADLVIVVGSANSSNSVRLVEVALEYGARAAHRVDYASEIQQEWLEGVASVGVSSRRERARGAGATRCSPISPTPGTATVEEVRTAHEDLMFSLPKELRTDASGNADERALGGRGRG